MREFNIKLSEKRLSAIRNKVRRFPWAGMSDAGGWSSGASVPFMRELAAYWAENFDWRAAETSLNRFPQYIVPIDGIDLHFYHVRSPEPTARPLLLLHGWPGSVFEFLHLLEPLSDPAKFGGDPADAFHVVVPSLPGFGFSGKPPRPLGPRGAAVLFIELMTRVLGYENYIVQGGDWGAIIASLMGHQDRTCCHGLHLNMLLLNFKQPPVGEEEEAWSSRFANSQQQDGAYAQIQMTKPQSLGFAMTESPVGVAAWIVEKFAGWSDLPRDSTGGPNVLARYTYDQLLTNVMIYLAQDSFVTSTWMYRGYAETAHSVPFFKGERCETPTAVAAFPDPVFEPPPRSMAARTYNIVRWTTMPRGGHFAALEAPDLWLPDVQAFARELSPKIKFGDP